MHEVQVKTEDLLVKVRENREGHRALFEQAIEVYRERAIEEIERILDDAKNGRKIVRAIGLVEPRDYTKEYDRVVAMLEMTVDSQIVISSQDFSRFVMDDWEWKEAFTTSTAAYLVT